ncbi:hypothetical protein N8T08_005774 [Aspergillus melleus]|uniref:Uncharacterized protein n=1 Tax=Aspergillus melleus TaxID=138277 RepID=A0ACC3B1H5_9EURO|nr:hypothetical protein N8T08_005774 [Aspergillus melleus]
MALQEVGLRESEPEAPRRDKHANGVIRSHVPSSRLSQPLEFPHSHTLKLSSLPFPFPRPDPSRPVATLHCPWVHSYWGSDHRLEKYTNDRLVMDTRAEKVFPLISPAKGLGDTLQERPNWSKTCSAMGDNQQLRNVLICAV